MAEPVQFKPELWEPLVLQLSSKEGVEGLVCESQPVTHGGFFPYQDPRTCYEVRGILPHANPNEFYHD